MVHGAYVEALAFSPNGRVLASCGNDSAIWLWDTVARRPVRQLTGHAGTVWCLAFTPDGKTLMSGGQDGTVRHWDVGSGKELRSSDLGVGHIRALAFGPDKHLLACGIDRNVRIWDVTAGRGRFAVANESGGDLFVAFSPTGRMLAVSGSGPNATVWDTTTGRQKATIKKAQDYTSFAFSNDERAFALWSAGGRVQLWDASTVKERVSLPCPSEVVRLACSPDGRTFATTHKAGGWSHPRSGSVVELWDATAGKRILSLPHSCYLITALAFAPDGRVLAAAGDGTIRLWSPATGQELRRATGHREDILALAWTAGGRALLSVGGEPALKRWDVGRDAPEVQERRTLVLGERLLQQASLSADGRALVTLGIDNSVQLWDPAAGKAKSLLPAQSEYISGAGISGDAKTVVCIEQRQIHVWDATTGARRGPLNGTWHHRRVVFHPDGRTLAAGGGETDEVIELWDPHTGRRREELRPPGRQAYGLAFSLDGQFLASGSWPDGGTVTLWQLGAAQERVDLALRPTGHPWTLAFSADGKTVFVGTDEGDIYLWDRAAAQPRARLRGHMGWVTTLAVHPGGRLLASGGTDTSVLLWDLIPPGAAGQDQGVVLTATEFATQWAHLVGDDAVRAYRALCRLVHAPGPAVELLGERLRPVSPPDSTHLARLIANLDSDDYDCREKSGRELSVLGGLAEPALRRTLARRPSPEARRRIVALLAALDVRELLPERLTAMRVTEVLEHIATPQARRLLQRLAGGAEGAWLTREAQASRARLDGAARAQLSDMP
jgi:WD40 repeat protein